MLYSYFSKKTGAERAQEDADENAKGVPSHLTPYALSLVLKTFFNILI